MITQQLRPWETLSREVILDCGRFLKVENHAVKLPGGQVIPDWPWLTIPSASIVLPVTPQRRFLCFRQTKYAVEGTSLATVGGMLEAGEDPLQGAKRELLEETGYASDRWIGLGSHILDPNRGIATMHLFLALDALPAAEPHNDDLEDQEIVFLSRPELEAALFNNEFKVLSWSAVVALSLNYLNTLDRSKA